MTTKSARIWRTSLAIVVAALLVVAFRDSSLSAMWQALDRTSVPLVVVAALINLFFNTLARAARWQALLPQAPQPDGTLRPPALLDVAAVVLAGQAANNLLPFRGGEAVRVAALRARHGIPVNRLIGAQLIEKVVEAISLAAFALPLVPLAAHAGVRPLLVAAAVIAVLGVCAAALTLYFARRGKLAGPLARVRDALVAVRHPRAWARSVGFAVASDAIDLGMIALAGAAVGVPLPLATCCVVLLAVNLAIALPSSPGQIGVLEAGAVLALVGMGVPREAALAFALVYHAAHLVPTTLAGGLLLCTARTFVPRGVTR